MNRRFAGSSLLVLLLAFFLAACETTDKKLEPAELASLDEEVGLNTLWTRRLWGGLGEYYHQFSLAVDDDSLYAANEKGGVFRIDKITGKKIWKASLDVPLTCGVAVDSERVFVCTRDGAVIALRKDAGNQVWTVRIPSEVVSAPVVSGNHLVLVAANGMVFDLDTADGKQRWRYDAVMPALSLRGNSRAAFFQDFVAVGQSNGKLAVLDLETGQLRWDPKVAVPQGESDIERIVDVDGAPLFQDEKLFAASFQGRVVAYDLKTGRLLWAEEESSYRSLATGSGNLYVTGENSQITAYDLASGEIRWVDESFLRRKLTAPVVVGEYLAVADFEGYIHLLSQVDGRVVSRARVAWEPVKTDILADGEKFYVIADNGKIKAFTVAAEER